MTGKKELNVLNLPETNIDIDGLIDYFVTLHPQKYTRKKDGKIVIKIEGNFILDFKAEKHSLSIKEKVKQT